MTRKVQSLEGDREQWLSANSGRIKMNDIRESEIKDRQSTAERKREIEVV